MGLLLAYALTNKVPKVAMCLLASWTGFSVGTAASNAIFFLLSSMVVFWGVVFLCVVAFVSLVSRDFNFHMLWLTAVFGAYTIVRSLAIVIGTFPVSFDLKDLQEKGAIQDLEPNFWVYMGVWSGLAAIGMACQYLILYLLKTRGKVPHPTFKEAIDSFEFAQSPEEVG